MKIRWWFLQKAVYSWTDINLQQLLNTASVLCSFGGGPDDCKLKGWTQNKGNVCFSESRCVVYSSLNHRQTVHLCLTKIVFAGFLLYPYPIALKASEIASELRLRFSIVVLLWEIFDLSSQLWLWNSSTMSKEIRLSTSCSQFFSWSSSRPLISSGHVKKEKVNFPVFVYQFSRNHKRFAERFWRDSRFFQSSDCTAFDGDRKKFILSIGGNSNSIFFLFSFVFFSAIFFHCFFGLHHVWHWIFVVWLSRSNGFSF